jgi:hypothetical protein
MRIKLKKIIYEKLGLKDEIKKNKTFTKESRTKIKNQNKINPHYSVSCFFCVKKICSSVAIAFKKIISQSRFIFSSNMKGKTHFNRTPFIE